MLWYYELTDENDYREITKIEYDNINDKFVVYFDGEIDEPVIPEPEETIFVATIWKKMGNNNYTVLLKTEDTNPKFTSDYDITIPDLIEINNNIYTVEISYEQLHKLKIYNEQVINYLNSNIN